MVRNAQQRFVGCEHDRDAGRQVVDERVAERVDAQYLAVALGACLDGDAASAHPGEELVRFRVGVQSDGVAQPMRRRAARLCPGQREPYMPFGAEGGRLSVEHLASVQGSFHVRIVRGQFAEHPHVEGVVADGDRVDLGASEVDPDDEWTRFGDLVGQKQVYEDRNWLESPDRELMETNENAAARIRGCAAAFQEPIRMLQSLGQRMDSRVA